MRRRLCHLLVLSCALGACQTPPLANPRADGAVASDGSTPPLDLPAEPPLTLVVVLGDSVAWGYGVPQQARFDTLLLRNDDAQYPEFAGRDVISRYPEAELRNLSEPGANSAKAVVQALSVPPNPRGRTLVLLSLGPTEFADDLLAALDAEIVDAVAARVEQDLEQIRSHFSRPTRYPDGAVIGLFSVLDPTDTLGTYPVPVDNLYCLLVAEFSKTGNVRRYNAQRERFAQTHGLLFLDIYRHFLGHGYFFAAAAAPHYQESDPSLWFQLDCLHPNALGHHQIRRLIWDTIFAGDGA